jgi:hypothetical protein
MNRKKKEIVSLDLIILFLKSKRIMPFRALITTTIINEIEEEKKNQRKLNKDASR